MMRSATRKKFAALAGIALSVFAAAAIRTVAAEVPRIIASSGSKPVVLGEKATRVPLEMPAGTLESRIAAMGDGKQLYLVLRDPETDSQPGVLYHLYLDLPEGATPGKDDIHYVGSLNFFGVERAAGEAAREGFRSFEITALVKGLAKRQTLTKQTSVTIIPFGTPVPDSHPRIRLIEIVEQ